MYVRCVVWVAWVWRGYDLNSEFTPDQSWLNPNRTDPIYAIKHSPGGSKKELPVASDQISNLVLNTHSFEKRDSLQKLNLEGKGQQKGCSLIT